MDCRRLPSLLLFVLGLSVALTGCSGFGSERLVEPPETPTWDGEVRALLAARCTQCHTSPPQNGAPDSFRLDKYDQAEIGDGKLGAFEKRERIIARVVRRDPSVMPPSEAGGPLTQDEQGLILAWVDGGAPRSSSDAFRTHAQVLDPGN